MCQKARSARSLSCVYLKIPENYTQRYREIFRPFLLFMWLPRVRNELYCVEWEVNCIAQARSGSTLYWWRPLVLWRGGGLKVGDSVPVSEVASFARNHHRNHD